MASSLFGKQQKPAQQASNPMQQLMGIARQGGDPRPIMRVLGQNNPQLAQVVQLMDSGTSMQAIAQQLCQQRGTTPEAVAKQLGLF